MAAYAISWDDTGTRKYETGTDHGVLYLLSEGAYGNGVPWMGLTGVTQSPDGAEANDMWADNMKYGTIRSAETFGGTIEAYQSPAEFDVCDGSIELAKGVTIGQQPRATFGFSYRTLIGSDTKPAGDNDTDFKLHLIYGATATPSERAYETVNDSPEGMTLSWEFDTVPVPVTNARPTSLVEIDSTQVDPTKLKEFMQILYGTAASGSSQQAVKPRLPLPDEIKQFFAAA